MVQNSGNRMTHQNILILTITKVDYIRIMHGIIVISENQKQRKTETRYQKVLGSILVRYQKLYGLQGHPYDCFPTGSMYVYNYMFVSLMRVSLYTQIRKLRHSIGLSQLMGIVLIEHMVELHRPTGRKLLVALRRDYNYFQSQYIPKVLKEPLK